ncbi:hypothetical protein ACFVTM_04820 [Arthrobacter sp. NPDC058130]|uniref:hypothetical protein n=1 Tax=Arthrobacter sp. NPDC058130 TaxID=3346353 RepID=UPI0036E316A6
MTLYQPEPVEISTRMRPGEWTEESLGALVVSYREKLSHMGAAAAEIDVVIDHDDGGGVSVVASWRKPAVEKEQTEPVGDTGLVAMNPDAAPLQPPAGVVDKKLFGLYLSDHLAGATAGQGRIERMAGAFTDTPFHAELGALATQIREERDYVRALVQDLGVPRRTPRRAAAWLAERAGRLKLNRRVVSRSPMTLVLETEFMRSAIIGKLGLWQTLQDLAGDLGLDKSRFDTLATKAREQLATLDQIHEYARRRGFYTDRDS